MTGVRDVGKFCWGWIHVVSLLIALALHGIALYAVASLFNKPVPQQKPLTVVVRMENTSPAAAAAVPPANPQQAAPLPSRKAKSLHMATLLPSGHEIPSFDIPSSPASSMTRAPVWIEPTASESQASGNPPSPPGMAGIAGGTDLAFFCPVRPAPVYPRVSRKMGEEGTVLLRVEWDREGKIISSRVQLSSGFTRLDEAALAAIHRWRCHPAKQDDLPVRAVGMQAFSFALEDE